MDEQNYKQECLWLSRMVNELTHIMHMQSDIMVLLVTGSTDRDTIESKLLEFQTRQRRWIADWAEHYDLTTTITRQPVSRG